MTTTTNENPLAPVPGPADRLLDAIEDSHNRWLEILNKIRFPLELLDGELHDCPVCGDEDSYRASASVNEDGRMWCTECHYYRGKIRGVVGLNIICWFWDCELDLAIEVVESLPEQESVWQAASKKYGVDIPERRPMQTPATTANKN